MLTTVDSTARWVYYLFLDSTDGLPYKGTSVDAVSLPRNALVCMVRHEVFSKNINIFSGFCTAHLLVFKNKARFDKRNAAAGNVGKEEPLLDCTLLEGLGERAQEPIIVTINATAILSFSLKERLRLMTVPFTMEDVHYILGYDASLATLLLSPNLTKDVAEAVMDRVRKMIKETTQRAIAKEYSLFLERPLHPGIGHGNATLYRAYTDSGGVLVAKVCHGDHASFHREVTVNAAVDHPNLVKFTTTFSIQNGLRHLILMPYYPPQHSRPARPTVCDPFSRPPPYCLDADMDTATEHPDWICLGATLAQLAGFDIHAVSTSDKLANEVERSNKHEGIKRLVVSCLRDPSPSAMEAALSRV
ncbi:hypothetical protein HDU96_003253 [Phlyctochytrium bullatum]|nr:hypothetical protein HDU96_003253 [Phlyctochytrium bullatum]